ncbi:MAG: nucleotidyltransferase [Flavobacteriaceae bacterium]|nr:nucleotidyltransferase [Flavobacteriaceae bacterium]
MKTWENSINEFVKLAGQYKVRMILVGGAAVNFYGYQRHSADVDFWIETTKENLDKLIIVFNEMGYEINSFPKEVEQQQQNISIKFSPAEMDLELITKFSINKTFDEAYKESEEVEIQGLSFMKWRVLSYEDLITSKVKANRPKDLLDIQQLIKIKNNQ